MTGVSRRDCREAQDACSQRQGGSYKDKGDCGGVLTDKTDGRPERTYQSEGPRKSADGVRVSVPADRYSLATHEGPLLHAQSVMPKPSSDGAGASISTSGTIDNDMYMYLNLKTSPEPLKTCHNLFISRNANTIEILPL